MEVVDGKAQSRELGKVLAVVYVALAFSLPPGCGTIWSILEADIESLAWEDSSPPVNGQKLFDFLSNFFSDEMLNLVRRNLHALAKSYLGIDFTFRQGKAGVAKSILESVQEEAADLNTPLAGFLGQVSVLEEEELGETGDTESNRNEEGWQTVDRRAKQGTGGGNRKESENKAKTTSTNAAESSNGEGGAEDDQLQKTPQHFASMQESIELVHLPRYKNGKSPRRGPGRKIIIKERSRLFAKVVQTVGNLYDPQQESRKMVSLYHGTRTSSLRSFTLLGIEPSWEKGEFSRESAFYVSNSSRHAFECPLHYKLGRDAQDVISVFEFRVDTWILHGYTAPPGQAEPFNVHWFSTPSSDWKQFCIANMATDPKLQATVPRHSYDIVVGPVCMPVEGGTDMRVISDRIQGDVFLTQLAFCTPRSWAWLESCFMKVFQEKRDL